MARHDDEQITNAVETLGKIGICIEIGGKRDIREITNVLPVFNHLLQEIKLNNAAQAHIAAGAGQLQRQRGSPGARADDCYRFRSLIAYQCFSASSACLAAC